MELWEELEAFFWGASVHLAERSSFSIEVTAVVWLPLPLGIMGGGPLSLPHAHEHQRWAHAKGSCSCWYCCVMRVCWEEVAHQVRWVWSHRSGLSIWFLIHLWITAQCCSKTGETPLLLLDCCNKLCCVLMISLIQKSHRVSLKSGQKSYHWCLFCISLVMPVCSMQSSIRQS